MISLSSESECLERLSDLFVKHNPLFIRGFYPRGKGEVHITVPPVTSLSPVRMVERGEIVDITVEVFTAGAVRPKVREEGKSRRNEWSVSFLLPGWSANGWSS